MWQPFSAFWPVYAVFRRVYSTRVAPTVQSLLHWWSDVAADCCSSSSRVWALEQRMPVLEVSKRIVKLLHELRELANE